MKHQENKTYELIPDDGGHSWHVRILSGDFVESVIQFGAITIGEEADDGNHFINFDFELISSPDPELTVESVELQETAGDILHNIMVDSLENKDGSVAIKDVDDEEAEWEVIE